MKKSIGIGTIVFAIFLTLKLAEIGMVANWSWWWVFSPFWIPISFVILILIFCAAFGITLSNRPKQKTMSNFEKRLKEMQEKRAQETKKQLGL